MNNITALEVYRNYVVIKQPDGSFKKPVITPAVEEFFKVKEIADKLKVPMMIPNYSRKGPRFIIHPAIEMYQQMFPSDGK